VSRDKILFYLSGLYHLKELECYVMQTEPNTLIVDNEGRSCLHYACVGGHLGCVQMLLDCRAPVYLKDKVSNRCHS